MISFRAKDVPFEVLYRYRPHQYGDRPVRFFILANDTEHKMGESPLPDGMIRVFRETGQGGLSFYVAQPTKYIPIKEKIELNVGKDDQVVYERVVLDVARQNFIYDETVRPTPPVVGLGRDAEVEGRDPQLPRQADQDGDPARDRRRRGVRCSRPARKLFDFQTVEYTLTVKPGEKSAAGDGRHVPPRPQPETERRAAGRPQCHEGA